MRLVLRTLATGAGAGLLLLGLAGPAAAHAPHRASPAHQGSGQVLANGQNHGPYSTTTIGLVCSGAPASYGLETAHHGPDSGTAGKGDGCYQADGPPGRDLAHAPII